MYFQSTPNNNEGNDFCEYWNNLLDALLKEAAENEQNEQNEQNNNK